MTASTHFSPPATLPPVSVTLLAVNPVVPPQVLLAMPVGTMPAGRLSVKVMGVRLVALRLLISNVKVCAVPFSTGFSCPRLLSMLAPVATFTVALMADVFDTPPAAVMLPVGSSLVTSLMEYSDGLAGVTSKLTVHEPLGEMEPSASDAELPPSVAVTLPLPQVVTALAGDATFSPVGRSSVKARLVSGRSLLLFSVMVTVVVAPPRSKPLPTANVLLPVTGCRLVTVSATRDSVVLLPCEDVTAPTGMTLG